MEKKTQVIANDYKTGEVLKIIREWTGLTQKEFGESLNRSRDSINNIENGRNRIYFDTVMDIAKLYHLKVTIEKDDK